MPIHLDISNRHLVSQPPNMFKSLVPDITYMRGGWEKVTQSLQLESQLTHLSLLYAHHSLYIYSLYVISLLPQ